MVDRVVKMTSLKILINKIIFRIFNRLINIILIIENQSLSIRMIKMDSLILLENIWMRIRIFRLKRLRILSKEINFSFLRILTNGIFNPNLEISIILITIKVIILIIILLLITLTNKIIINNIKPKDIKNRLNNISHRYKVIIYHSNKLFNNNYKSSSNSL